MSDSECREKIVPVGDSDDPVDGSVDLLLNENIIIEEKSWITSSTVRVRITEVTG